MKQKLDNSFNIGTDQHKFMSKFSEELGKKKCK